MIMKDTYYLLLIRFLLFYITNYFNLSRYMIFVYFNFETKKKLFEACFHFQLLYNNDSYIFFDIDILYMIFF